MFHSRFAKLAALVVGATALGSVAVPAAQAGWGTPYYSRLDVMFPSAGTITSDASPSGQGINCGADFGSPGPCTIVDEQDGGSSRPTTGWYDYTLRVDGGPAGYSWTWTSGCSGTSPTCTITNDQEFTTVAGEWTDTQPPVMDVVHVPGTVRPPAELYASAHDNSGAIHHYTWVICHVDGGGCLDQITSQGSVASLGTAPDGTYVVTPFAYDNAGNWVSGVGQTMTVDSQAPDLRVTSPANRAQLDTFVATAAFTVADPDLLDVRCSYDGGAQQDCSTGWQTPYLDNGPHTLSVQARDAAGNASTVERRFTIVDPTVTLVGAASSVYRQRASITVQVPRNSFAQVEFDDSSTGAPLCIKPAGRTGKVTCTFSGSHFRPGVHDVFVRFTGDATHKIAGATFGYTVVRLTPTLTAKPQSGQYGTVFPLTAGGLPRGATGTVEFRTAGGQSLCTATVRAQQAACNVKRNPLAAGTYQVQAAYSGDALYLDRAVTFRLKVLPAA